MAVEQPVRILSLDGGGALGVFTLGVLSELERMLDRPLHEVFHFVYGTSTGSIIASLVALGEDVDTIKGRYMDIVPKVMRRRTARGRSRALERYAREIFRGRRFDAFLVGVGIVATHLEYNRPMVFKNDVNRAHGSEGSFAPGFGCTIAEAVVASCAAFPMFKKRCLEMPTHGERTVVDGGFVANNPTLFAMADVLGPLAVPGANVRVLSVGTGTYPERRGLMRRTLAAFDVTSTVMTLLKTSSNAVETVRTLLFKDVPTVRVDTETADDSYRTDILEYRTSVLERIYQLGRKAFADNEPQLQTLLRV